MEKSAPQKAEKLVAVKGMNDILPGESARWEALESTIRSIMRRFAFDVKAYWYLSSFVCSNQQS